MRRMCSLFITVCCLGTQVVSTADAQTLGRRAIERFDTDGDGRLSWAERRAARDSLTRQRRNSSDRAEAKHLKWQVRGIEREALVYVPEGAEALKEPAPVVFGFHGHGGSATNAARSFRFHKHWPEALVVYMQGIPTPGRLTDPQGKRNGWQHGAGDQSDRDLEFFDAVLATLQEKYKVDSERIYASGHSNGGGFTYLLWAERPDVFAALAPSAASSRAIRRLKPKPAMHVAGRNDKLVLFAWQERAIEAVRRIKRLCRIRLGMGKGLYPVRVCHRYALRGVHSRWNAQVSRRGTTVDREVL